MRFASQTDTRPRRLHTGASAAALVIVSAMALSACGSSEEGNASDSDEVVIGLNLEMSGGGSFLGTGMEAGIKAAVDAINAEGGIDGRTVKLITKDNESDPTKAVNVVSQLKREGADIILGPGFSQDCVAAAPTLAREEIVGMCMSAGDLPEESSHMFGVGLDYTTMETTYAEQFGGEGAKNLGLVVSADTSGDLTVDIFVPAAEDAGVKTQVERFNSPATDLTPQLLTLSKGTPEHIRLDANGPDALLGVANIKALGITTPVWLPNSAASLYFADQIKGDVTAGNVHTWIPAMLSKTGAEDHPEQAEQINALKVALPEADTISAAGWDAFQIVKSAIEKAGSVETDDVIEALQTMEPYNGSYAVQQITAEDHRGARSEGTLLPARFTADGGFELVN